MCAGTQCGANIGPLVFGMSERQLLGLTENHTKNPTLDVPSRYVFFKGQKAIKVWGCLADAVTEVTALHLTSWK